MHEVNFGGTMRLMRAVLLDLAQEWGVDEAEARRRTHSRIVLGRFAAPPDGTSKFGVARRLCRGLQPLTSP